MCARSMTAFVFGSLPGRTATRPPSFGNSGTENRVSSLSVKPAAFIRAATRSAARVQEPTDWVVLVSTSSL